MLSEKAKAKDLKEKAKAKDLKEKAKAKDLKEKAKAKDLKEKAKAKDLKEKAKAVKRIRGGGNCSSRSTKSSTENTEPVDTKSINGITALIQRIDVYSTTPVVSYDNLIDTISHDIKILLQGVIVKSINNIIASSEDLKNEIRILSNDIATLHYRDIPQILRRIETLFEMYNKYNLRERIATLQLKLQQVPKHSIPPSVPVTR